MTTNIEHADLELAVIGMACRLPGADNPEQFWCNLRDGVESISTVSDDELLRAGVPPDLLENPDYVKRAVVLDDMENFDASFFNLSPREAAVMDPQHRHFLECGWHALEDAGYVSDRFNGSIGVFGGSGHNAYLPFNLLTNPDLVDSNGFFLLRHTSNDKDFLTTKVSYLLDLQGPSVNVQTACSTSLVAIHLACQSLLNGECDIALAGGVTIELPHRHGYLYKEGEIFSPDGHCRAFDARSKGTVFGSGAGIVVLKRLSDAIEDGDNIRAVVKGSAINNDGSRKAGYLAPSVDGQAKAIAEALQLAEVSPSTISYVETHGTGTPIGDPIEIAALSQAFGVDVEKQHCAIGSLKTNIGHLDTAAGVAGFIKTVLALEHRQIPASLHFERPNPSIDFENSPFYVNAELNDWQERDFPRRAGVSSLGVGGTNAHVVLEEKPARATSSRSRSRQLLLVSARTEQALDASCQRLGDCLDKHPEYALADVAYTLQVGRRHFAHGSFAICENVDAAVKSLRNGDLTNKSLRGNARSVTFMFPGQGAQFINMGKGLYETEPAFRQVVDRCSEILRTPLGLDLRTLLFPPVDSEEAAQNLKRTEFTQPALFVVEYALAQLWDSWGIRPTAMIGHSIGEYAAACLAGVFSLEKALELVATRGRMMQQMPAGAMLMLAAPEAEVTSHLLGSLSVAAINGQGTCVVAGQFDEIQQLNEKMDSIGVVCRPLRTSHAFHSPMMDPILDAFTEQVRKANAQPPTIPFVSNVTGTWISASEATDPTYWANHLRNTVRFEQGLRTLFQQEESVLLEVGPGNGLSTLAFTHADRPEKLAVVSSLPRAKDDVSDESAVLRAMGQLWMAGIQPDWNRFYSEEKRYRVSLPGYPFERKRHWIEPGKTSTMGRGGQRELDKLPDITDWYSVPKWLRTPPREQLSSEPTRWLVLADESEFSTRIVGHLRTLGHNVHCVVEGNQFGVLDNACFEVVPDDVDSWRALFGELAGRNEPPERILHLWGIDRPSLDPLSDSPLVGQRLVDDQLKRGFYSLLFLAQALGVENMEQPLDLLVVANGTKRVEDEKVSNPVKAAALGPCQILPLEYPNLRCRFVDLADTDATESNLQLILNEFPLDADEPVIAFRGQRRLHEASESLRVPAIQEKKLNLRHGGTYLLTGGLGGIGITIAEHLAKSYRANLILVSRSGLPARETWAERLSEGHDKTSQQIRFVKAMECFGSEVTVVAADITERAAMTQVIHEARQRFGGIDGVIHAAGTLDDGMIQLKTAASAAHVLKPKIEGTLLLQELLAEESLDFFVAFSSVSSIVGVPGQVDYAAANAFLDAMAQSCVNDSTHFLTINWGQWQEVGMSARLAKELGIVSGVDESTFLRKLRHPLLSGCLSETEAATEYVGYLSSDSDWVLSEHRLKNGTSVLPGTAYLELALATWEKNYPHEKDVELSDVYFLSPMIVPEKAGVEIRVTWQANDADNFEFAIRSRQLGAASGDAWQENVRGRGRSVEPQAKRFVLQDLIGTPVRRESVNGARDHRHLSFGPRWGNLHQVEFGQDQALATLELPDEYASDLSNFRLHPAMLDMATGCAQSLIGKLTDELYVPASYERLQVHGRLEKRILSHIRYRSPETDGLAIFDVVVLTEEGKPLVTIDGFRMKRVPNDREQSDFSVVNTTPRTTTGGNSILELGHLSGILPAEGIEAFRRALGTGLPQVIVVSQDLESLKQQLTANVTSRREEKVATVLSRSELSVPFVAPAGKTELKIAGIWEETLGINGVGIHDDFIELGGHSLMLTQVILKIRKQFDVELPLSKLMENPTVHAFAVEVQNAIQSGRPAKTTTLKRASRESYRSTRPTLTD